MSIRSAQRADACRPPPRDDRPTIPVELRSPSTPTARER